VPVLSPPLPSLPLLSRILRKKIKSGAFLPHIKEISIITFKAQNWLQRKEFIKERIGYSINHKSNN
jgi:hypothetical protein